MQPDWNDRIDLGPPKVGGIWLAVCLCRLTSGKNRAVTVLCEADTQESAINVLDRIVDMTDEIESASDATATDMTPHIIGWVERYLMCSRNN